MNGGVLVEIPRFDEASDAGVDGDGNGH
jgi:hypothetical protein